MEQLFHTDETPETEFDLSSLLTYKRKFFLTKDEADFDIKHYSKLLNQYAADSQANQIVRSILLG